MEEGNLKTELAKCLNPSSYEGKSKKQVTDFLSQCYMHFFEYGSKNGVDHEERNALAKSIIEAAESGTGISLPDSLKSSVQQVDQLFSSFVQLINPPSGLEDVFEYQIIPFLEDSEKDSSFTLSIGPGSEPTQFFPHDDEFQRKVFQKYSHNVVLVFEGAQESGFGDVYGEIFNLNEEQLTSNPWMTELLQDLTDLLKPNEINITLPNDKVRILECKYEVEGKDHTLMLVLFYGDFVRGANEENIMLATSLTSANFLLCGIRHGDCADILFRDSEIFFPRFQTFLFTHGMGHESKQLKNRNTSFRMNLRRLRNVFPTAGNFHKSIMESPSNEEARGFPNSKLCARNGRLPANDPYCVQGKVNSALFWSGLGGKKRRQTKRMKRKGRKTRKH